jgi:archaellum biogenesis protein FlaJ (TadC family)
VLALLGYVECYEFRRQEVKARDHHVDVFFTDFIRSRSKSCTFSGFLMD